MSLDVYIMSRVKHNEWQKKRENSLAEAGEMKGLIPLIEEYYGNREPDEKEELYWANITHNLGMMADAAGIYKQLWRPEELGIKKAGELIAPLTEGIAKPKADPAHSQKF